MAVAISGLQTIEIALLCEVLATQHELRFAPKKINGFRIVRVEIATVACGSFAMTLLVHFLLHTS